MAPLSKASELGSSALCDDLYGAIRHVTNIAGYALLLGCLLCVLAVEDTLNLTCHNNAMGCYSDHHTVTGDITGYTVGVRQRVL